MDAAQWPPQQIGGGLGSRMEEIPKIMGHNKNKNNNSNEGGMMNYCSSEGMVERRGRGQREQNVNCPRCQSGNTKFCYYNNYSLSQPRYFCKTCRRYWTQGGSLRNVPVGGGSRKNKRSSSILASSSSSPSPSSSSVPSNKLIPDLNPNPNPNPPPCSSFVSHQNPNNKFLQGGGQDLNLAFPIQGIFHPNLDQQHQILPKFEAPTSNNSDNHHDPLTVNVNVNNNIASTSTSSCTTSASSSSAPLSALELLRTGIATRGSLNTFVPMPMPMPMPMPHSNTLYPSSGFPSLHHPNHNHNHNMATLFPPPDDDPHQQHGIHDHHNIGGGAARLFFPFADMNKIASSTTSPSDHHHHHHHHPISDQTKGVNDHHPHHQASTGYWTGLLGGGNW